MSEKYEFQAEVSRLLEIVAHALYTEKEIFLRELISNASDACDHLRYAAIETPSLITGDTDFRINVSFDPDARTIKVSDNGIGMDRDGLVQNLGTIAHSGTRELLKQAEDGKLKDANLIGQFGVGFYSVFMVAKKVEVLSHRAGTDKAWIWVSEGDGKYTLDEALKETRGTEITIHLKEESGEYLLEDRIKEIVKKYSDHISFPILLGDEADGPRINKASALWVRSKNEVEEEQYKEFYRNVSGTLQLDEPWQTLHWRAEGAFEYHNLLFIPAMKPFDLYDPRRAHGVKLYVRRVFITDGVDGLIPPFLRFLKGVVDSEDLPLNISREMLQSNPIVTKMCSAITRKVLGELQKKAEDDPKAFAEFWDLFGAVIKEGLYDGHAYRDTLCKVVRFYSSKAEGLVSLKDYVGRMQEGQEFIYYLSAPTLESARNSPQLEAFRAKNVEVLFMTDSIDEFWIPIQANFDQKNFKSVTRGDSQLEKIYVPGKKETAGEETENNEDMQKLIARFKDILAKEVSDVTLSNRLVDSPVCLVAPEGDVDIHMQQLLKKQPDYEGAHQHILEINAKHPVIHRLEQLMAKETANDLVKDTAYLLLDQARIVEGEPLKNPTEFVRRMSLVIEKGLFVG